MRYDNDMMPVEIRARDLTPGDLVSLDDLRRAVGHTGLTWTEAREVASVSDAARHDHDAVFVDLTTGGGYVIPADTPVTVRPVICADCGHPPMDCECNDEHEEN